jgi:hypothetical protein
MKICDRPRLKIIGVTGAGLLLLMLAGAVVFGQTAPVLTIAESGTNEFSIIITNGVLSDVYNLYRTPVLGNLTDYPWKFVTNGAAGQTNFTVFSGQIDTSFYQVMVATNNTIGSFSMFIDSPVNGANLTQ